MANDYRAKIGLDTSEIEKNIKSLSRELKTVDKDLESNAGNAELSAQRYQILGEEVAKLQEKMTQLLSVEERANEALSNGDLSAAEYRAYRREIESTQAQIEKYSDELTNTGKAYDELDESVQKSAKDINIFQEILKADAVKAFASGAVDVLKSAFQGAVSLVQEAADAYGEYEQLVGGVETLFAGAEATVRENAQKAFGTAGISANQYMEQVTSFAASLVNSLGGNTEEAARVADQAIIDMSDNANKMGTSIQSIQYAYQGFAKQNYTMLDNLKLGYGGTKKEMQRLIDDVNSWREANGEAADLSIENFADVVTAIHEVQEHIGLTGTTAEEASKTIQGSAGAVQAAWQNLLVGLADPTADLDSLINDLIDTGMTAAENMLPTMMDAVGGLALAIGEAAPHLGELLENADELADSFILVIEALVDEISNNVDVVFGLVTELTEKIADHAGERAPDIITKLAEGILKALPVIADTAVGLAVTLINTLADTIPELLPKVIECITKIGHTIAENTEEIVNAGVRLAGAILEGLWNGLPDLLRELPDILQEIQDGLYKAIDDLLKAGEDAAKKIGDDLKKTDWSDVARETVESLANALVKAGQSEVIRNILAGVTNGWSEWIFNGFNAATKVTGLDSNYGFGGNRDKLKEETEELERTAEQQLKLERAQKYVESHNKYIQSQIDKWSSSSTSGPENKKSFEELLEEKESEWDKLYKYDKESYNEYWNQRMEFLMQHEEDTKEWWTAYNETDKKLKENAKKEAEDRKKAADEQAKAAEDARKKAEQAEKDRIDAAKKTYENALVQNEIRQLNEGHDENWLLEEDAKALEQFKNSVGEMNDDYQKALRDYLKQKERIEDKAEEQKTADHKEQVKAWESEINSIWDELENQAKVEQWSADKLLDEKEKALAAYADKDPELYDKYFSKIADGRADAIQEQIKKEEKQQKEIITAAQKAAEKLVTAYEKRYSDIMGAVEKPQKVTDINGKERLVFSDYHEKLKQLRDYQKNLEKLKEMGLSSRHLQEIFSMDFDTRAMYISELLKMGAGNRERYLHDYEAYADTADEIAKTELDFDTKLTEDINKVFEDVDGYENGKKTASEWLRGFEEGLKGTPLEGYEVKNIVDSETTAAAEEYDRAAHIADLGGFGAKVYDVYQLAAEAIGNVQKAVSEMPSSLSEQIKAMPINIWIDNKKTVMTCIKDLQNKQTNSSAKG